jgi:hypothetical protein
MLASNRPWFAVSFAVVLGLLLLDAFDLLLKVAFQVHSHDSFEFLDFLLYQVVFGN